MPSDLDKTGHEPSHTWQGGLGGLGKEVEERVFPGEGTV